MGRGATGPESGDRRPNVFSAIARDGGAALNLADINDESGDISRYYRCGRCSRMGDSRKRVLRDHSRDDQHANGDHSCGLWVSAWTGGQPAQGQRKTPPCRIQEDPPSRRPDFPADDPKKQSRSWG